MPRLKAKTKGLWKRDGRHAERYAQYMKARYKERASLIALVKAVPCFDCSQSYPSYVMDFDHVTGVKHFNIGSAVHSGGSLDVLWKEIEKCVVVCANCHRERTHRRSHK